MKYSHVVMTSSTNKSLCDVLHIASGLTVASDLSCAEAVAFIANLETDEA